VVVVKLLKQVLFVVMGFFVESLAVSVRESPLMMGTVL
jgi:hypothetical protein